MTAKQVGELLGVAWVALNVMGNLTDTFATDPLNAPSTGGGLILMLLASIAVLIAGLAVAEKTTEVAEGAEAAASEVRR